MNQVIEYVGERLWAGWLGNAFLNISFVSVLISCCFYFLSSRDNDEATLKKARLFFRIHTLAVIGIAATLFVMLLNHYFEYWYVSQHSSKDMEMRYIFSCFWEGQEGSFLLWIFWHSIIGLILTFQKNSLEAPAMFIFTMVQAFLITMIFGVVIGDLKIGSNPFILLRENPDFANIPLFKSADYVDKLSGRGLNPLLQNYWMTIHPPTLFLGFALTLVPFCYAIAGIWKKKYFEWQSFCLPWTFTGILILGTGILMGGAWAYEALSFGGFWAWDPVENASLVPWIILTAAGHLMIVNKNRKHSLFSSYLFSTLSFILVLYSTFLTRSGVLGNASVHSFTDLGMQKQLLLFMLLFCFLPIYYSPSNIKVKWGYAIFSLIAAIAVFTFNFYPSLILIIWGLISVVIFFLQYFTHFPKEKNDEEIYSREFWIFAGSLILFICAITITVFTSIPIFNKLFNQKTANFSVQQYNDWEMPFAVIILFLMALAQYLRYKNNSPKEILKIIWLPFLIALGFGITASVALYFNTKVPYVQNLSTRITFTILLVFSLFSAICNMDYWLRFLKGKIRNSGSSLAHIGFSLLMLGALISMSKKQLLSKNTSNKSVENLGKEYSNQKSLLLTQGDTLPMGNYYVAYSERIKEGIYLRFRVEYFSRTENGSYKKEFELKPCLQLNERMGTTAEPDTRHFGDKDIYSFVTYAELEKDEQKEKQEYKEPVNNVIHLKDTLFASNAIVILDSLVTNVSENEYREEDTIKVTATLKCIDINNQITRLHPVYNLYKNQVFPEEVEEEKLGLRFLFWKINPDEGSVEISLSEKSSNNKDFIVMEAYLFPFINILWVGCIVMMIGTAVAIVERVRKNRHEKSKAI